MTLGIEGITVSPGYSYQHAPRQDVFLGRTASKRLFREVFRRGREAAAKARRRWSFNHSSLFLDFLAGNQAYQCTPWSTPTYNIFGWQRPCYLLTDEGYASSFRRSSRTPTGTRTAWARIRRATTAWPTAASKVQP